MTEPVKLFVHFSDEIPMGSEALFGMPLDAGEGGGTYELVNVSLYCALAPGDVVRAELNHDSRLQIVAVESLANRVVSALIVDPESVTVQPSRDVDHASIKIARRLEALGAHVEGPGGALTCSWPINMTERQVRQRQDKAMTKEPGWRLVGVWPQDARQEVVDVAIDAALQGSPQRIASTYWAVEDDSWAELGVDDPAVLARIQTLVAEMPGVLPTIEAGLHENILVLMERLAAPNPNDLPRLDGPLLVESDEPVAE